MVKSEKKGVQQLGSHGEGRGHTAESQRTLKGEDGTEEKVGEQAGGEGSTGLVRKEAKRVEGWGSETRRKSWG